MRAWYETLQSQTIAKIWRREGLSLSLNGHDVKKFKVPGLPNDFRPPLPTEAELEPFLPDHSWKGMPADPVVAVAQARKEDRRDMQSGYTTMEKLYVKRPHRRAGGGFVRSSATVSPTNIAELEEPSAVSSPLPCPGLGFPPVYPCIVAVQEVHQATEIKDWLMMSSRVWNLGRVCGHRVVEGNPLKQEVRLELLGTYDRDLIKGKYAPAHLDEEQCWVFKAGLTPVMEWYDWDADVFVTDLVLNDSGVLVSEDQAVLRQSCKEKSFPTAQRVSYASGNKSSPSRKKQKRH